MGDTVVKWFSDFTIWIGALTVLPQEGGVRSTLRGHVHELQTWVRKCFTAPGTFGASPTKHEKRIDRTQYETDMLDRLSERLHKYVDTDERGQQGNEENQDTQFYHYVLARECRNVQKDLGASPPKKYRWSDWEYYLKLMGDEEDPEDYPGQRHPDILVPETMKAPDGLRSDLAQQKSHGEEEFSSDGSYDGNVDRQTSMQHHSETGKGQANARGPTHDWSWLSDSSPLMSSKSEAEWILERLSAALERELNRQRKGYKTKPPITLKDVKRKKT